MHLSQVKQEMQQVWCDGWSRVEAQTGNPHWFTSVVAHRSVKPLSAQASTIDIESCVGTRGMTATSHLHDELQYCPCLRLPGKEAKNVLQKDEPPCQRGSVRVGGAGVNTMKKSWLLATTEMSASLGSSIRHTPWRGDEPLMTSPRPSLTVLRQLICPWQQSQCNHYLPTHKSHSRQERNMNTANWKVRPWLGKEILLWPPKHQDPPDLWKGPRRRIVLLWESSLLPYAAWSRIDTAGPVPPWPLQLQLGK